MTPFQTIYEEALFREGGADKLKSRLPVPRTRDELCELEDSYFLSVMSRRIFRAGLKHSMVDAKWPVFEEVFHGFDINRVRLLSDDDLGTLMKDDRLIRHWGKIKSVRANAQALHEQLDEQPGFGSFLAQWPSDRVVELWDELKKRFTQLGGQSGPYFLRMVGKDTFLLTPFVIRALIKWGVLEDEPKTKKAKHVLQTVMNQWSEESGRPLCQVSMILGCSVD